MKPRFGLKRERRLGVRASLRVAPDVVLDAAIEDALYHVTMESLNNTLKHAGAALVEVLIETTPRGVRLQVIDDGCGFDTVRPGHGMGLANMRERVLSIGGRLAVDSAPGRGTRVTVLAPETATGRTA